MRAPFVAALWLLSFCTLGFAQSFVDSISVEQLRDGSELVRICYRAHNIYDSTVAVAAQGMWPDSTTWSIPLITLLDTLSSYPAPNYGWNVDATYDGVWHCFLWHAPSDIGEVERCGFRLRFAVYDSMLSSFRLVDSFSVHDTLHPEVNAFGLAYHNGKLWVLFHSDLTHECWLVPYAFPDMVPTDTFFVGTVTVGPSDIAFAGDRLFWTEDTRVLLKEYDFETGESHVVRGDWWDLPGTENHIAGAAFDGEKLWVCFCSGTFVALDTSDFSLVDTMFFSDFGADIPATCADGLAWGLGLLWCFSNDNIIYAIDVKTKSIVYEIPTGEVVVATGAEGCAWDGVNLWVVDYGRGFVYKVALFDRIQFYVSREFCLDNVPPRLSWIAPSCPDYSDTFAACDSVELSWTIEDSNAAGGTVWITQEDDTLAVVPAETTHILWSVFPWPGWDGSLRLSAADAFGNENHTNSCRFCIASSGVSELSPPAAELMAFPNPFNDACVVVGAPGAEVEVFDIFGRAVDRFTIPRSGRATWSPKGAPTGVYLIRLHAGGKTELARVVYLR